ncbi:O-acetyl-ADP-ribose deacetylase [Breoghania sp.]|uniref:O-acetyl-ADP-ribose deacetylase n=1 Tax=Breoghania sp. TaxID=2065378 RepID=UPI002AA80BAC|nr:O-acetyl-ADP-ribose deacetylase [Breoghania sp.]
MKTLTRRAGSTELVSVVADITTLEVGAIVNAANETLLGGGGVDGAIHRAAGPELLVECRELGGCAPGDARITAGYRLPAPFVIHTVGPRWAGGAQDEDDVLTSCYARALELAAEAEVSTIAFPAISTGVFGFPAARAAKVALAAVLECPHLDALEQVTFCCFDRASLVHYEAAFAA